MTSKTHEMIKFISTIFINMLVFYLLLFTQFNSCILRNRTYIAGTMFIGLVFIYSFIMYYGIIDPNCAADDE